MSYEKWYEKNSDELQAEYDIVEQEEGTDGYDFADFVIDKWHEEVDIEIDSLQDLGIHRLKESKDWDW